jgi:hypothetical protein
MIGDLSQFSCTVGSLDLVNTPGVTIKELNIYEDMDFPTGPMGDITVIDGINALDTYKITGSEKVSISFTSADFGQQVQFNLSLMKGVDYKTGSSDDQDGAGGGSLYHKQYTLQLCTNDYVMAQGNYVNKSYNMPCHEIVSDIVSNYFKGGGASTPDGTLNKVSMIARFEHPVQFLNRVIDNSISSGHKSSLYVLYKNRTGYVYETYENAFGRSTGVTLTMRNTLKTSQATYQQKLDQVLWYNTEAFYRPSRVQNKSIIVEYNMGTGGVVNTLTGTDVGSPFTVLGQYIYTAAPSGIDSGVPIFLSTSPENNPEELKLAQAKQYRIAFQSQYMQDSVHFTCIGRPAIVIGSTMNIVLPDATSFDEKAEQQVSSQILVTSINHKIRPINITPRYLMHAKGIKCAFATEGGGAG